MVFVLVKPCNLTRTLTNIHYILLMIQKNVNIFKFIGYSISKFNLINFMLSENVLWIAKWIKILENIYLSRDAYIIFIVPLPVYFHQPKNPVAWILLHNSSVSMVSLIQGISHKLNSCCWSRGFFSQVLD